MTRLLTEVFRNEKDGYIRTAIFRNSEASTITHYPLWGANATNSLYRDTTIRAHMGYDVYFTACTCCTAIGDHPRDGTDIMINIPAFFMDIETFEDAPPDFNREQQLPADKATALRDLAALPLPPSACVDSGRGIQAYWILETPINAVKNADKLRQFANGVRAALGDNYTDVGTQYAPDWLMRVDDTVNYDVVSRPHYVRLLTSDDVWRRYDMAELTPYLAGEGAGA